VPDVPDVPDRGFAATVAVAVPEETVEEPDDAPGPDAKGVVLPGTPDGADGAVQPLAL